MTDESRMMKLKSPAKHTTLSLANSCLWTEISRAIPAALFYYRYTSPWISRTSIPIFLQEKVSLTTAHFRLIMDVNDSSRLLVQLINAPAFLKLHWPWVRASCHCQAHSFSHVFPSWSLSFLVPASVRGISVRLSQCRSGFLLVHRHLTSASHLRDLHKLRTFSLLSSVSAWSRACTLLAHKSNSKRNSRGQVIYAAENVNFYQLFPFFDYTVIQTLHVAAWGSNSKRRHHWSNEDLVRVIPRKQL